MNKKIKSLVLAAVMGLSLTTVAVVPTTVEAASAGAAETLIGGAVAYAYVSRLSIKWIILRKAKNKA